VGEGIGGVKKGSGTGLGLFGGMSGASATDPGEVGEGVKEGCGRGDVR